MDDTFVVLCYCLCVCGTATKLQLMHPVHNLRYMHAWTLNSIDISALRKLLLRFRQCFDVPSRLWGRTAGTRLTPRLWFAYQHGIGPYAPTLPLGMCAPTLERLSSGKMEQRTCFGCRLGTSFSSLLLLKLFRCGNANTSFDSCGSTSGGPLLDFASFVCWARCVSSGISRHTLFAFATDESTG